MVELPERVVLVVGETATFPLSAAWRGGYRWTAVADPAGVASVDVIVDEPGSTADPAPEQLVVRGMSRGDAVIDLRLARSWEPDAADERRIHVHVRDRGSQPIAPEPLGSAPTPGGVDA
jgi:hypothetical protein